MPTEVKRGRGRPKKFQTEEERKAVDAGRKRDERAEAAKVREDQRVESEANAVIAAHPDNRGRHGEVSGGNASDLEAAAGAIRIQQQMLGGVVDSDEHPVADRRRTVVPVSPDNDTTSTPETDSTHVNTVMRREARNLRKWIKGETATARCNQDHQKLADSQHASKTKVWCRRCGKLLVNPGGKQPKNIQPYSPAPAVMPTPAANILDGSGVTGAGEPKAA